MHAGDQSDFPGLTGCPQTVIQGLDDGVEACSNQGAHVQGTPDGSSSTPTGTSPAQRAAVVVQRCNPHQRRDLLAIQLAQFGQLAEQGARQDRANPFQTAVQSFLLAPQRTGIDSAFPSPATLGRGDLLRWQRRHAPQWVVGARSGIPDQPVTRSSRSRVTCPAMLKLSVRCEPHARAKRTPRGSGQATLPEL